MVKKFVSPEVSQQATEVIGQLNQMSEQSSEIHKIQQAELARTNARLYELLGNLYKQYVQVIAHSDLLEAVLVEMISALKVRGQRAQKNKPLNTFVRYVFGTDRQRTYNYKCCLQAALDQNIAAGGFKVFILRQGGIEACKLKSKPKSFVQDKAKIQAAYARSTKNFLQPLWQQSSLPLSQFKRWRKTSTRFCLLEQSPMVRWTYLLYCQSTVPQSRLGLSA